MEKNQLKQKKTSELFEERTGVKYQNWIQAWMVTLKLERKKQMKKLLKLLGGNNEDNGKSR